MSDISYQPWTASPSAEPPDMEGPPPNPYEMFQGVPGVDVLVDMECSSGRPEDLTTQQLQALRTLFEEEAGGIGLYFFTLIICGARDMYLPLHLEMCEFLSTWGNIQLSTGEVFKRPPQEGEHVVDNNRRLMLCVPRDHFKTTVATRSNGLWTVTKDTERTLGIWNENGDKAKSWVGATRKIIEASKLYHLLWPEVLPRGLHFKEIERGVSRSRDVKWGDSGFCLERNSAHVAELTVEPFGIGGASAGKHFTHVIKDDIIGDKAAESDSVMEDAIEWINTARALERPAENGCELFNFTRWGFRDVYSHALAKWKGQYKVYLRHMLEDEKRRPDVIGGKVIFPTRFRTTQAREMYQDDPFVFMSQYMNIPMSGRTTSFQHSWIRYGSVDNLGSPDREPTFVIDTPHYDNTIMDNEVREFESSAPQMVPLHWMDKAIILDPAPSKKTEIRAEPRAANGIVVVGKDPWGRRYHLDSIAVREDPVEVLKIIIRLAKLWSITKVGIEEVNFSKIYSPLWTRIMMHEHPELVFQFIPLTPGGFDKTSRILTMAPPMKEGFWYYNREASAYTVKETIEFPNGETVDLIDAQSYADKCVQRLETPEEMSIRYVRDAQQSQGRSPITGY